MPLRPAGQGTVHAMTTEEMIEASGLDRDRFEAHIGTLYACCTEMTNGSGRTVLGGRRFIEEFYHMACECWKTKPDGWHGPMPQGYQHVVDYDTVPPWRPTIRNILEEPGWHGLIEGSYVIMDMDRSWVRPFFSNVYHKYLLRTINLRGVPQVNARAESVGAAESLDDPLLPEHLYHLNMLCTSATADVRNDILGGWGALMSGDEDEDEDEDEVPEEDDEFLAAVGWGLIPDDSEDEVPEVDRSLLAREGGGILERIMDTEDQRLNEGDYMRLYDILKDLCA